jgi:competence ComEA-like helix-hairpin-helix protein
VRTLIAAVAIGLLPAICSAQRSPVLTPRATADFNIVDVGQGDAILIHSPEGKAALIDAGPSKEVVASLKRLGVTSIDLVVVTHHHADHYGGMEAIVREFRPRFFLATASSHTTPHYLRLLRLVRDSNVPAIFPTNRPRRIELGSVLLTVLPQPPEDREDENDNSIGLRVQHGSFSMLLTGDSQARERAFWESHAPELVRDCTVLKLAHHGSKNGTDARWLSLVRPKLAVASLGAGNEYGHPHAQTLALLERRGIPLLRTDVDGTISTRSDGKNWEVVGRRDLARATSGKADVAARRTKEAGRAPDRIDINTATQKELESLPGVGPTIARRIIRGRPYRTVDDLRRIEGIGEKRLEEIRPLVSAR